MTKDENSLKSYNIVAESIVKVKFKFTCNFEPCNFSDKFFYKDVQHTCDQK